MYWPRNQPTRLNNVYQFNLDKSISITTGSAIGNDVGSQKLNECMERFKATFDRPSLAGWLLYLQDFSTKTLGGDPRHKMSLEYVAYQEELVQRCCQLINVLRQNIGVPLYMMQLYYDVERQRLDSLLAEIRHMECFIWKTKTKTYHLRGDGGCGRWQRKTFFAPTSSFEGSLFTTTTRRGIARQATFSRPSIKKYPRTKG